MRQKGTQMISVKKLLLKTIEKTRLRTQAVQASVTVSANNSAAVTTNLGTLNGDPVGIVGFALAGSNIKDCSVAELHLNGTTSWTVRVNNTSSSAVTVTVSAYILIRG